MTIKNLKPRKNAYYATNSTATRGYGKLAVKVNPGGQKHFYIQYRHDGRRKFLPLGAYPEMSLKEAGKRYDKYKQLIYDGIDPRERIREHENKLKAEKKTKEEAAEKARLQGSLGQLVEFYLDDIKKSKSTHYYKDVKSAFNNNLKRTDLNVKAHEVTKDDIIKILHPIAERGSLIMGNRMRAYLSAMFQYGIAFDNSTEAITRGVKFFIPFNPVTPVQKLLKREPPRERTLSEKEVQLFWQALDDSKIFICRKNVFKLMLATGQRLSEVAGLRWSEIEGDLWTLPGSRTKNRNKNLVPLNKIAMEIIESTPKLHNIFVFPAQSMDRPMPIDGFSQALSRLLQCTDIDKFVPKDLRRTFKTLTGKAGISKEIRDRIQNHAMNDVSSKHYDHYEYLNEKRRGIEIWNETLSRIITA